MHNLTDGVAAAVTAPAAKIAAVGQKRPAKKDWRPKKPEERKRPRSGDGDRGGRGDAKKKFSGGQHHRRQVQPDRAAQRPHGLDNGEPKRVSKKEGSNPHKERAPNRTKEGVLNPNSEFLFRI